VLERVNIFLKIHLAMKIFYANVFNQNRVEREEKCILIRDVK